MTTDGETTLLAAQAVAGAESFLAARSDGSVLAREADRLTGRLMITADEETNLSVATRLLVTTMSRTAVATGMRANRWADVMQAFARLVRDEARWRA